MPVLRPSALRSLPGFLRHSSARTPIRAVPGRTQLVARRYASSGGHGGHGEPSSDLPWLLSALAVTPPALWYLWPDTSHAEHHGGHEEHAEEGEEKEGEEEQSQEDDASQEDSASAEKADEPEKGAEDEDKSEEKSDEETDEKSEEKSEEKSDDSKDNEESSEGKTEKKEGGPENQGNTEDVQFKGKMKQDSDGRSDERKTEPRPSKGTNVRRIDSGLAKKLGEGPTYDEDDPKKESQSTSKEAGNSPGDITNKQKGLSTTDTKHSIQIDQHDDKSKKGSGEPETAKAKGTVDSSGPITGGPGKN